MEKILKAAEVRKILGVCRTTLYQLDKKGELKSRKLAGNRLYYLESDVDKYLKSLPFTRW
jgi:predicted site-specific integrase-resolvase